jgi:hypothetical protein
MPNIPSYSLEQSNDEEAERLAQKLGLLKEVTKQLLMS